MGYPDKFIRGISRLDEMAGENPDTALFKVFKENSERLDDGFKELSINWYDNESALVNIFEQRRASDGEISYKIGAAIFWSNELDRLCERSPYFVGNVLYERAPIDGNDFHGNILLKKEIADNDRKKRDMIAAAIIVSCFERVEIRK